MLINFRLGLSIKTTLTLVIKQLHQNGEQGCDQFLNINSTYMESCSDIEKGEWLIQCYVLIIDNFNFRDDTTLS